MFDSPPLTELPALLREDDALCEWLKALWDQRVVRFGCNDFGDYNFVIFSESASALTADDWSRLERLSFVESVAVEASGAANEVLRRTQALPCVRSISLNDIDLTPEVAELICGHARLVGLMVGASGAINSEEPGAEIHSAAVRLVASRLALKSLWLDRGVFSATVLAEARRMTSLEELMLYSSTLDDEGLPFIGQILSLRSLMLTRTAITSEGLRHLATLTNLKSLRVDECRLDGRAMEAITKLGSLTRLDISASSIPEQALRRLDRLSSLKELDASQLPVSDRVASSIGRLTQLTELTLSDTPISDEGTVHFASLVGLRRFSLAGTAITDATLDRIARWMPELESLDVSGTAATDAGLARLSVLQKLKSLDFCETQARGACYDQLRAIPAMKYLRHSELPLLRRRRNLVRFSDVDFVLDCRTSTLDLDIQIQADKVVRAWSLEINCRREGVPSGMQPAHINGPPLIVDFDDWRNFERKEFRLQATTEPLGNLYIGWHHFANRHRIRFGRRKGNRFRIRWVGYVHAEDFIVDPRIPGSRFLVDGIVRLGSVTVCDLTSDIANVDRARSEALRSFTAEELGEPTLSANFVRFPIVARN